MALKFYTSVSKGLKLKARKFLGLIRTFVEVTGTKWQRERPFCAITHPPLPPHIPSSLPNFINDECNLNYSGEFLESFFVIYTNELQLKCEPRELIASFLDLDITVADNIYKLEHYEMRENYPFFISHVPDISGSIPACIFYRLILSEFLRISKSTLKFFKFVPKA